MLADVVDKGALDRLEAGTVKRFEFRVARPTNAAALDPNNWENDAFRLMSAAGAGTIEVAISTRAHGGLGAAVKQAIHRVLDREETRAARVQLEGEDEAIDLFADRVSDSITVTMHGLYPDSRQLFAELAAARDRCKPQLDAFFGVGADVLV